MKRPGSRGRLACGGSAFRPSLPALVFAALSVPMVMQASIALTFQTVGGGITLGGSGTDTATLAMGNISRYGSVPAGVTRTTGAANYTVSTPVGVRVTVASESSTSYFLRSRITTTSVHSWIVNGVTLTTTAQVIATNRAYATTYSYPLDIQIADAQTTGLGISTVVNFNAVAN